MTKIHGVDLSHHNGAVNFAQLAENTGFAMLRGGYRGYETGAIVKDSRVGEYASECNAKGIPMGLYFFSQAINTSEAIEEANWLCDLAAKYKVEYPLVIDTEMANSGCGRADGLNRETRTEVVRAFCDTVERRGYYAAIYASESWYKNNLIPSSLTRFDVWVAKWSTAQPNIPNTYGMWQYSNKGNVAGVCGAVDLNVATKGYPSIIRNAGLNNLTAKRTITVEVKECDVDKVVATIKNTGYTCTVK